MLVNLKFNKEGMNKDPVSKLREAKKIAMKYLRYMKKNNFMNIKNLTQNLTITNLNLGESCSYFINSSLGSPSFSIGNGPSATW